MFNFRKTKFTLLHPLAISNTWNKKSSGNFKAGTMSAFAIVDLEYFDTAAAIYETSVNSANKICKLTLLLNFPG